MMAAEQRHRHPPVEHEVIEPSVLSGYGTGADNYSLSSGSHSSSSFGNDSLCARREKDNSDLFCTFSTGGDTSSAASSIDYFAFPESQRETSALTVSDPGTSSAYAFPHRSPVASSRRIDSKESDIDEYMLSMLNTASELSSFSMSTTCSRHSTMNRSIADSETAPKARSPLAPESTASSSALSASVSASTSPPCSHETASTCSEKETSSPLCDGSKSESEAVLDLNLSEVESLIRELKSVSATLPKASRTTPKFSNVDDQYTTNSYVTIVRNLAATRPSRSARSTEHEALQRTSSWAADISPRPPPLPATSVPGTPIMSRYRIMNVSSMRVRPGDSSSPSSAKASAMPFKDEYFSHPDECVSKKVPNLIAKFSHNQKFKPMVLYQPTNERPEAHLYTGYRDFRRRDGGIVYKNPLARLNSAGNSENINRNILTNTQEPSTMAHSSHFEKRFFVGSKKKAYTPEPADVPLFDLKVPYEINIGDRLDSVHEAAVQALMKQLSIPVSTRIKQWVLKLDVLRSLTNRFSKTSASEPTTSGRLFGMPLYLVQAENKEGFPFPKFIMDIMDYLRESALKSGGIFRRCGSKRRILEMREICDVLRVNDPLPDDFKTVSQVHDLSDLLKQYLRALPQRIVPESISELVFLALQNNSSSKLDILKYMMLALPNENRDALYIMLDFLGDIAMVCESNKMTVDNLSICTMPSLFYLYEFSNPTPSPSRRRKTVAVMNDRDTNQYRTLKDALSILISNRKEMRFVPPELLKSINRKKKPSSKDGVEHPLRDMGELVQ